MIHPIQEAVARALCEYYNCCATKCSECRDWTAFYGAADTAILALAAQEPTLAMVKAATEASDGWLYEHEAILVIKAALAQLAKEVEGT